MEISRGRNVVGPMTVTSHPRDAAGLESLVKAIAPVSENERAHSLRGGTRSLDHVFKT
jgi:hypothetical protein